MLVYDVSMLNAPIDVSREFTKVENIYFHSARIKSIEAEGLSENRVETVRSKAPYVL